MVAFKTLPHVASGASSVSAGRGRGYRATRFRLRHAASSRNRPWHGRDAASIVARQRPWRPRRPSRCFVMSPDLRFPACRATAISQWALQKANARSARLKGRNTICPKPRTDTIGRSVRVLASRTVGNRQRRAVTGQRGAQAPVSGRAEFIYLLAWRAVCPNRLVRPFTNCRIR